MTTTEAAAARLARAHDDYERASRQLRAVTGLGQVPLVAMRASEYEKADAALATALDAYRQTTTRGSEHAA